MNATLEKAPQSSEESIESSGLGFVGIVAQWLLRRAKLGRIRQHYRARGLQPTQSFSRTEEGRRLAQCGMAKTSGSDVVVVDTSSAR